MINIRSSSQIFGTLWHLLLKVPRDQKIKVHMHTYNILLLHTDIMWQTLMFQFAQFHVEFGL